MEILYSFLDSVKKVNPIYKFNVKYNKEEQVNEYTKHRTFYIKRDGKDLIYKDKNKV